MKRLFYIFLFLLIACPAWGAKYFPFVAGESEVRTYFALPNPTGTVKDLNAQIKILNAGGTVTLNSFTGKFSIVGDTAFITNPSVDLRKYVGYKITINDGTNDLVAWIRSAGTIETEEDKVTDDNSTFASDTGFWTKGTGWTIGSNVASYSGTGAATVLAKTYLFSFGQLVKYSVDLAITTGAARVYLGQAYDVQHATSGTKTGYVTCGTYVTSGIWGSTVGVFSADNLTMKLISTPSATGVVVWNGVGNSWVAGDTTINPKATSYTVTIGNGTYKSWLAIGDSKSQYGDSVGGWQQLLLTALHTAEPSSRWVYINRGISSKHVAWYSANIDDQLSTIPDDMQQDYIFLNFGPNDWKVTMPDETTWKTQYQYIIDACHTKFPTAIIYITKPWQRGHDADAVTMGGWIDDLIAANSTIMFLADDETGWLEGGNDGATMTLDGTHFSTAGQIEKKNQMLTVMGY